MGARKGVAVYRKQAVVLLKTWVRSFALLFSVLVERLPDLDSTLLDREYKACSWLTQKQVVARVQEVLRTSTEPVVNVLHAEVLSRILLPKSPEAAHSLLTAHPRHFPLDLGVDPR